LNDVKMKVYTDNDTPDKRIMGLWERTTDQLYLDSGVYSQWNRDAPNPGESKTLGAGASNSYSTHPFYLGKARNDATPSGYWFGFFYNNAAAADYWLTVDVDTEEMASTEIHSRASGGLGDIYIILSDTDSIEDLI
jgi:hypothetical protein